jgi:aerobic carbon-monoxide dehydrogenase small subunit
MMLLSLRLNGEPTTLAIEAREHLGDVLRERCGLTATHLGCEHGACGACSVIVEGVLTRSCLKLAAACDGLDVWTLEGLRDDPTIVALRAAFQTHHALQCGFCTPGMLIAARDLILRGKAQDERTVRAQLSGHICRCTGYVGIVTAILSVAQAVGDGTEVAA